MTSVLFSQANGPTRLPFNSFLPPDPSFTCTEGVEIQLLELVFQTLISIPDTISKSLQAF